MVQWAAGAGVEPGWACTFNLLGPDPADGSPDQLAFLILTSPSQLGVRGGPQGLGRKVQGFPCPAPSPALAWASPAQSAPPHRSWTPAALLAAPEQPAARPLAAESCRDIRPITPAALARSWRVWAEGRGRDRVPRTLAEGHGAVKTLWLHAGACRHRCEH